jgi:ABC-type Fe3+-hydroxamate transport system substrate-binding protein
VNEQVGEALSQGQSLYTIDENLLQDLEPDVILTQDICSVCAVDLQMVEQVASRMERQPQVTSLNPMSLQDVLDAVLQVGEAVGLQSNAKAFRSELDNRIERVLMRVKALDRAKVRVAFIEWTDPLYIGGHWTPQLISMAGGHQTLNAATQESPAPPSFCVTFDEILATKPEVIIVCPCGLTMDNVESEIERLAAEEGSWWGRLLQYQEEQERNSEDVRIAFVDGDQMFNRPGPRLVDALEWLVSFLHPDDAEARGLCPPEFPWKEHARE